MFSRYVKKDGFVTEKNREGEKTNRKDIENILKDYHWMINSIKILNDSMQDAVEGLTAQYGAKATLPKPLLAIRFIESISEKKKDILLLINTKLKFQ